MLLEPLKPLLHLIEFDRHRLPIFAFTPLKLSSDHLRTCVLIANDKENVCLSSGGDIQSLCTSCEAWPGLGIHAKNKDDDVSLVAQKDSAV